MIVTFHFDDKNAIAIESPWELTEKEREQIVELVDMTELELGVLPTKGDNICFIVDRYDLKLNIDYNYINYYREGNPRIVKRAWGLHYDVYIGSIDVVDMDLNDREQ